MLPKLPPRGTLSEATAQRAQDGVHPTDLRSDVISAERGKELDSTARGRRQHEVLLIAERCGPGFRAKRICELAGITDRTLRYWLSGDGDFRRDWRACRAPKARQLWEAGIELMRKAGDGRGLMLAAACRRVLGGLRPVEDSPRGGGVMYRVSRTILVACALLLLGTPAGAESGRVEELHELQHTTAEQRAAVQTHFMKTKLDLAAEQLVEVESLNLEFARKADPVLKGSSSLLTKRWQLKALDEAKLARLQRILTPDQLALYSMLQPQLEQTLLRQLKRGAADPDAEGPTP